MEKNRDENSVTASPYAGFGKRLYAYLIVQSIIQGVALLIVLPFAIEPMQKLSAELMSMAGAGGAPLSLDQMPSTSEAMAEKLAGVLAPIEMLMVLFVVLMFLIGVVYGTLMEGSRRGATVGKRYCGLRVTDAYGDDIGYGAAAIRNAGINLLSVVLLMDVTFGLILLPAYLLFFVTKKKQTLHDLVAKTTVIRAL